MAADRANYWRGYINFIGGGLAFGIIVGIIIIWTIELENPEIYFYLSAVIGLFAGLLIAARIDWKIGLENWYVPLERSADFDDAYKVFADRSPDINFLRILKVLDNRELVIALTYQYYYLQEDTRVIAIKEIAERNISAELVKKYYSTFEIQNISTAKECPRCNSRKY
ncbi:MAG: hypothetical protein SCALA702_23060 [Melioribacteraceae bacterium]|nr:MAG: hypothetical protein SCALA702_23060 [Melioribacteraceae bacterium]